MFSGIVSAIGRITKVEKRAGGARLAIDAGRLGMRDVAVGDSIAVNGVCLTVIRRGKKSFSVDVSRETLRCTTGLAAPGEVNLEKALRLADRFDGHLVAGHVDAVGEVVLFAPAGESRLLRVRSPVALARYIARKGSITLQGISLTVNAVSPPDRGGGPRGRGGCEFEVNLIPHTLAATTLKHLRRGSRVNLEVDLLARYVEQLLATSRARR